MTKKSNKSKTTDIVGGNFYNPYHKGLISLIHRSTKHQNPNRKMRKANKQVFHEIKTLEHEKLFQLKQIHIKTTQIPFLSYQTGQNKNKTTHSVCTAMGKHFLHCWWEHKLAPLPEGKFGNI